MVGWWLPTPWVARVTDSANSVPSRCDSLRLTWSYPGTATGPDDSGDPLTHICYKAMESAAALIKRLRRDANLSQEELARRAGCTRSTIARIESNRTDPTLTMLARIVGATHRRLVVATGSLPTPSLAELVASGRVNSDGADWTSLRAFVDWTSRLGPDGIEAIIDPPARTGNDRIDNLVAAIAEKISDDAGVARPRWTAEVTPLGEPWRAETTTRRAALEEAEAPAQFRARCILLAEGNLWRGDRSAA